jgi:hypothetical protein
MLAEQPPVFGTQGVPAPNNVPGPRYEAVGWVEQTKISGYLVVITAQTLSARITTTMFGNYCHDLFRSKAGNSNYPWKRGHQVVLRAMPGVRTARGRLNLMS